MIFDNSGGARQSYQVIMMLMIRTTLESKIAKLLTIQSRMTNKVLFLPMISAYYYLSRYLEDALNKGIASLDLRKSDLFEIYLLSFHTVSHYQSHPPDWQ